MLKVKKPSAKSMESIDYGDFDFSSTVECTGMPKVVQEVVKGKVVNKVVFVVTPPEEMNKGLSVNDFALENLLASGVEPKFVGDDSFGFSEIDKIVENVESNVEP